MNMVKKILSFSLIFFISCGNHTETDPLYPVPILKVKLGEIKTFHLSNYFRDEKVYLLYNQSMNHISLDNNDLIIDALSVSPGFEEISLLANGHPLTLFIKYDWMVKHTFLYESESAENVVIMGGFNDWSRTALPLEKNENLFTQTLFMEPKKHEYKFVVDGKEEIDPANPVFMSNNIGGWNSILDLSEKNQTESGQLIKSSHDGKWLIFDYLSPNNGPQAQEWTVLLNNTKLHADIIDPMLKGGLKINIASIDDGLLRIIGRDSYGKMISENQTILKDGKPLSTESEDWHEGRGRSGK